mmetsp:Transcript_31198/g.47593  ORF Transcript_31198/g.47593 Transcript_31198/m.47593 type:complete len:281 (-) Transcript_31198:66-908(-)|eukprot:CAMPEP_0194211110 /NCGR_PEP_ID=MMETSP0156-20130528/9460_1 /TAXON_ID=33649 /ORGANISM="Thalassionema nitzschioides, Strain L26-B" /LENGTH=280 /DNA_ID=CAMNT_0038938561 /DNA_START=54 /DNA_END=896 /DNA_ORIENTATION=+
MIMCEAGIITDVSNHHVQSEPRVRRSSLDFTLDFNAIWGTNKSVNSVKQQQQQRRATISTSNNVEPEILMHQNDTSHHKSYLLEDVEPLTTTQSIHSSGQRNLALLKDDTEFRRILKESLSNDNKHYIMVSDSMQIMDDIENQKQQSDCISVHSTKRQVREELDQRNLSLLKDEENNEFRRIQATLRNSGMNTGMGSLQLLDGILTQTLIERKRRRSMDTSTGKERGTMDQRATKTMIHRRQMSLRQMENNDSEPRETSGQHIWTQACTDLNNLLLMTKE